VLAWQVAEDQRRKGLNRGFETSIPGKRTSRRQGQRPQLCLLPGVAPRRCCRWWPPHHCHCASWQWISSSVQWRAERCGVPHFRWPLRAALRWGLGVWACCFVTWAWFTPKFYYAKRRFSVISKYRHIYEVLNIGEIKTNCTVLLYFVRRTFQT
jgi:hypothetical protein